MKPSIIPADAAQEAERLPALTRAARALLLGQLRKIRTGACGSSTASATAASASITAERPFDVTIRVRDPRFYSDAVFAGTVGAGEAYINGHWQCDDLTALVRLMVVNRELMNGVDSGWSRLSAPLLKFAHWLNRNDKDGSRRNIAAHYDLGNGFFGLFLDETMAYSCGIFRAPMHAARGLARQVRRRLQQARAHSPTSTCSRSAPAGAASPFTPRGTTAAASPPPPYRANSTNSPASASARPALHDRITLLLQDYRDLRASTTSWCRSR